MRRMGFALVILTTAALATPAASAEPVPADRLRDFVDEVADPDFEVGEEAC